MHILLGLLGTVVTILWLLHRLAEMGIDLGGLNPWLWNRRRTWKKKYEANPIYSLEGPMEVTALLITATAKADGEMSSDEKHEILEIFEDEFKLSKHDAAGLLTSSTYLYGKGDEVRSNLKRILAPSLERFTAEQASSAIELLDRISITGSPATVVQLDFISEAREILSKSIAATGKWDQ